MIIIKNNLDIEKMKKASEVVALTHELLKENAKPGVSTLILDRLAEEFIVKNGGIPSFKNYKGLPGAVYYPASICASLNNQVVHGIPNDKVLKDGDILSVDIGVFLDGYHGDAARTLAIGNISQEAQKLIDVSTQSFFEGIKNAVEGNRIFNISESIQNCVEENGFSVVRDYVGHGIGKNLHEEPQIPNYVTKTKGPRLLKGMTLAIEPMVNEGTHEVKLLSNKWTVVTLDGSLSAHYENTILITDKDPIILTLL